MSDFDKDKCANTIAKVAFEVFQSLPDGEPLLLTKHGIGKPRPNLTSFYQLAEDVYKKLKPVYKVYYVNGRWIPEALLSSHGYSVVN